MRKISKKDINVEKYHEQKKKPLTNSKELDQDDRSNLDEFAERSLWDQNYNNIEIMLEWKKMTLWEALWKYTQEVHLRVYVTTNRALLQLFQGNREINKTNVVNITKNIQNTWIQPQLSQLNTSLEIIDWQHRDIAFSVMWDDEVLWEWEWLAIPTMFFITPEAGRQEIVAQNTARTWRKPADFLHSHRNSKDPDVAVVYNRFAQVMNDYNVWVDVLTKLVWNSNTRRDSFRNWNLQFSEDTETKTRQFLDKVHKVYQSIYNIPDEEIQDITYSRLFPLAIQKLLLQPQAYYDRLLKKISLNSAPVQDFKDIKLSSEEKAYLWMAKIYNHAIRNPEDMVTDNFKLANRIATHQKKKNNS